MVTGTDEEPADGARRKARLSQADVPSYNITEALRVPSALRDEYGKQPTRPLMVAKALNMSPTGSTFRMVTGAAVAYGLTDSAAQGELIGLTALGRRTIAPTVEGDDTAAIRDAVLQPRVVREFLHKYDGSKVPSRAIAINVLEDMGVPGEATGRALDMILDNAKVAGFLEDINGQDYVNLDGTSNGVPATAPAEEVAAEVIPETPAVTPTLATANPAFTAPTNSIATNKRVFVSHGKNSDIVNQIKELLTFGGFEPIVSVEKESVSKPVPDKVMDDMRSCGAGIVHVGSESTYMDKDGNEVKVLNENVLIEIGGAMALYKRNFILLVEKGVTLPSNLQGLYEVRYEGDKLDYESTMKLLKAFNDFKLASAED
ncbi:MAG TPA: TIR domain-containing protein [Pseudolysinimonas sp.]|jgi:predicted nucleotide-binding protein